MHLDKVCWLVLLRYVISWKVILLTFRGKKTLISFCGTQVVEFYQAVLACSSGSYRLKIHF